ncbi:threonine ammonia-lyase [Nocardioides mangrovicus]|uniref:L-threonine dehydratase catabolic TdcB n=1 Tax=Nocardioides mangrovicus TaxID=2478913 RepID=A0A3L8P7L4_9ACTN|nr:threonine ammonia-lyase [Nocardioides mangrovicus]RLV50743.1 threonine ammonia-lyase [Nocardioides mangrovicus]
MTVTLDDVRAAQRLLEGTSVRTPMVESRWLTERLGGPVHLKCENLQRTGSFKIRGAYNRMFHLTEEERAAGVVAASAGNHAQGVALAAQLLGIKATIFMPEGAPIPKLNATRGYGAEVIFHGPYIDQALEEAQRFSDRTGAVLIHPFNHEAILAGQGTCGLEILEQAPDVATVLVPLGGGGLIAGSALAMKESGADLRIVGVQAAGAAAWPSSLQAGHPVPLQEMKTMADGIAVGRPGDVPFAAVEHYVDDIVVVSEDSLSAALVGVLEREKLVVEPSGGAAVAALLDAPDAYATPVVAVLSGGNVDPLLMGKLIRHGMAAAGRYLSLRVRIPDTPGGLARLLTELASLGANVLDVAHERVSDQLSVDEVDVQVQLETRGADHAERVIERLRELEYVVSRGR